MQNLIQKMWRHINAHGTADTLANDKTECAAIQAAFKSHVTQVHDLVNKINAWTFNWRDRGGGITRVFIGTQINK